jgi:hypothetical protein
LTRIALARHTLDMKANKKRTLKSKFLRFPEVKGKILEAVEIDPGAAAIILLFDDGMALSFDLDSSHAVFPELSRRKSGNWTPIKKWNPVRSSTSVVKW